MRQFNLKNKGKNKGQVLMLALIMFSIVSVLSAVMASMWQAEIEVRNQEKNSLRAFYLAQSGIERAKIWIKRNPSYSSFPYDSGWLSDLPGGRYSFRVSDPQGALLTLSSVGEILDTFANSLAKRRIEVKIQRNSGTSYTKLLIHADGAQAPQTYSTLGSYSYTVPSGISFVIITAYGAQGNSNTWANGALGGKAVATVAVTPGETLSIYVGGQGGYNGGGAGGGGQYWGTNGGGASDVRRDTNNDGFYALGERIIVAGGGGAGAVNGASGGNGGGANGTSGGNGNDGASGGGGGTQLSFGGGGSVLGQNGQLGIGGASGTCGYGSGGGGGGGYYGGGGGGAGCSSNNSHAGGGGGSGYVTGTGTSMTSGVQSGDGKVVISTTTLTDSSLQNHTITAVGNASTTTVQSKFGGSSAAFDGNGDYLTVPDSDDWNFGSGDFTIDLWVNSDLTEQSNDFIEFFGQGYNDGGNNYMSIDLSSINYSNPGKISFHLNASGSPVFDILSSALTANTWYHVAATKNGSTYSLYINGVLQGTASYATALPNYTSPVYISKRNYSDGYGYLKGYLDEFRVSKGIARWTNTFTPPSAAYSPDDGDNSSFTQVPGSWDEK